MAVRWSRWSPQFALIPAVAVTLVAFVGAFVWTIWLSFTSSKRFPGADAEGLKSINSEI